MPLIGLVIAIAAAAALLGGWAGLRMGSAGCAQAKVAAAQRTAGRITQEVKHDAKVVAAQQRDDEVREGTFRGVRHDLEEKLAAAPAVADRECLDPDLLRLVNAGRGDRAPAVPAEPHAVLPAARGAQGREGGDGGEGAHR